MKLNAAQIIFLSIIALMITYLLTSVFIFGLNHQIKMLPKKWTWDFTIQAVIHGYPKIWQSMGLAFLCSLLTFLLPFIPKRESLHGEARFANAGEVRKMKLYGDGIIIGKYKGKLLRFGGQQFVALGAPTRSGKGVGIVIPNLLDWKESAVVQDIKQECFEFTSKYRQDKLENEVFLFNPFDRRTHRYNPLAYIDMQGENADGQLTDFANILYPMSGDSTTQFFNQLAQNLFIGLCYMANDLLNTKVGRAFLNQCNSDLEFNLYGILQLSEGYKVDLVAQGDDEVISISNFETTYQYLAEIKAIGEKAQQRIDSYFKIDSDNTRSGVMSSFNAPLMIFRNDNMRLATSANDFDFRNLRKKKMTIYVGITPDQLANAKLILNIFWQQLIGVNIKELPQSNPELKYKTLLVMDEFTAPGALPIYLKSVSFIAGYWLRSLMIYQNVSQLEQAMPEGYGKEGARTLLSNHACQIFYTPREQEDAEKISKILGNKTTKNRSRNLGTSGGGSESDTARALMLPQELRAMTMEQELITIDNGKPIMCNKAFYYNDLYFMNKFKEVSPSMAKIKGIPTQKQQEKAIQAGETYIDIPIQSFEKMKEERKSWFENKEIFENLAFRAIPLSKEEEEAQKEAEELTNKNIPQGENDENESQNVAN
ncbi:type IV secretory system conjugative DNA transfer family protein [Campylobacter sp.]|uniref:type IV secretory system conjugative DNA transfer family protein n=1 Tax=Campylobacter sp. TaxID=205 RepID=UPI002A754123|nr:type IV secretory system conjugative DNA transfer family protein [Campylobacter sp.]MDY3246348.1 type IV secretory system conjugative DNA transfer family protein [Campylobacter sp.]MDY4803765.1 type IV secretory system conjugative DNA transfer family protein [Campylobacter sp.]